MIGSFESPPIIPKNEPDRDEVNGIQESVQIDKRRLKEYTKSEYPEERAVIASEIRAKRNQFFDKKTEVNKQLELVQDQLESKQDTLNLLKAEISEIEGVINEESSSLFNRTIKYFEIKSLKEELIGRKPEQLKTEEEVRDFLMRKAELENQLQTKQNFEFFKNQVNDFYNSHIEDFKKHQEYKHIEELKHLVEEEKQRQVETIMNEHNSYFVHGILDRWSPGENSLIQKGTSFETKLKLALSLEPTLSTSVIQKGDGPQEMWAQMGLLVSRGRVEAANQFDASSRAEGVNRRTKGFSGTALDDISKNIAGQPGQYNEFIVSNPRFAGMFISEGRHESNRVISDKNFFDLAKQLNLPTYYIQNGEVFSVSLSDDETELKIGEKIDPTLLNKNSIDFKQEEKNQLLQEIFDKEMPFKITNLVPEARMITSLGHGANEYVKIQGNQLAKFNGGLEKQFDELGIDASDTGADGKPFFSGKTLRLLKEIKYPNGLIQRIFENNGRVFKQGWDFSEMKSKNKADPIEWEQKYDSEYIDISYGTWKLDRIVHTINDYLQGMEKEITDLIEEEKIKGHKDEKTKEYYSELKDNLAFHLYGFSEAANELGDSETFLKATALAEKLKSKQEYSEIIDRRLDETGRFKITKNDLG